MTQRYTSNDSILSKYILNKTKNQEKLPYMTEISAETGVSVATISRYAKRKGFYSFADMRASFNKELERPDFDDRGLIDLFMKNTSFAVTASQFAEVLGDHIVRRLESLKYDVKKISSSEEVKSKDIVVVISISGDSLRVNKLLTTIDKNKVVFVTAAKLKSKKDNINVVSLSDFISKGDSSFERYKSLREVFIWLDDILNIVDIKKRAR